MLVNFSISASEIRSGDHTGSASSNAVSASLFHENLCDGSVLLAAYGYTTVPDSALDISPSLKSARLKATIPMTDGMTGNFLGVSVDLNWSAGTLSSQYRRNDHLALGSDEARPAQLILTRVSTDLEHDATVTGSGFTPVGTITAFQGSIMKATTRTMSVPRQSEPRAPRGTGHPVTTTNAGRFLAGAFLAESNGCDAKLAWVFGATGGPGNSNTGPLVNLLVDHYNSCTGDRYFSTSGEVLLPPGALQISSNLSSAALRTTVQLPGGPVSIDLTWQATKEHASHGTTFYRTHGVDLRFWNKAHGTFQSAEVKGSITTSMGSLTAGSDQMAELAKTTESTKTVFR
jgi:hypothetical protein